MIIFFLIALVQADKLLSIIYPEELAPKFQSINFIIADFGFVPYGQQFSGKLEIDDALNFCSQNEITNRTTNDQGEKEELEKYAKILVVMRGNCTFATKASNAQRLGYQMLIIVNNIYQNMDNIYMISINNNEEIDIPVIMINKNDGDQIIDYLQQPASKNIKIYISFPEFPKSQTILYEYWYDVMDQPMYQFIQQFYIFHREMQDQLHFIPHYLIIQCDECRNDGFQNRNNNCLSGGRYCASDPDENGPMTGQDVVLEILRQLCIYNIDPINWWNYVIKYNQLCLTQGITQDCYNEIINIVNLNNSLIEQCIVQSFTGNNYELDDNTLLSNEYLINYQQIGTRPLLFINQIQYYGSLTVLTYNQNNDTGTQDLYDTDHFGPLQAICRTFNDEDIPETCQEKSIGYMDKRKWVENNNFFDAWIIWIIVISASVLWGIGVIVWYKRMVRRLPNVEIKQEFHEQEKSLKDLQ